MSSAQSLRLFRHRRRAASSAHGYRRGQLSRIQHLFRVGALYGKTRTGKAVRQPDYDGDGHISLSELLLCADHQRHHRLVPIATSDDFPSLEAEKGEQVGAEGPDVDALPGIARPERRAVIEELSKQLELKQEGRMVETKLLADKHDKERKSLVRNPVHAIWETRPSSSASSSGPSAAIRGARRWRRFSRKRRRRGQGDRSCPAVSARRIEPRDRRRGYAQPRPGAQMEIVQRLMQTLQSVALAANLEKVATPELQEKYKEIVREEACLLERGDWIIHPAPPAHRTLRPRKRSICRRQTNCISGWMRLEAGNIAGCDAGAGGCSEVGIRG